MKFTLSIQQPIQSHIYINTLSCFKITQLFNQAGLVLRDIHNWPLKEWDDSVRVLEMSHFYVGKYMRYETLKPSMINTV